MSTTASPKMYPFQFLIGRLKTPGTSVGWGDFRMFQFLIGRLKTIQEKEWL